MAEEVYKELCKTMAKRGGLYPGMDIPELYEPVEKLSTPEGAAVSNALPRGFSTVATIAKELGGNEDEVAAVLEDMAHKGLCVSSKVYEMMLYAGPPFVAGIFEFQFMRGTNTERDRNLAKLKL